MKKFLNFETLITPILLKVLYPILVIYYLINHSGGILRLLANIRYNSILSTLSDISMLTIYMLAFPFILRVAFEVVLAIFRLYENSYKMANPDKELTGVINSFEELKKATGQNKPKANFNQQQYYNPNNQNQGFQQNQGFAPNQPTMANQGQGFPQAPVQPQGQPAQQGFTPAPESQPNNENK